MMSFYGYTLIFVFLFLGIGILIPRVFTPFNKPLLDAGVDSEGVKKFYDWFGSYQDYNKVYELGPIRDMVNHLDFANGSKMDILELGCGTGSNAKEILDQFKDKVGSYTCIDISSTMVELATSKLSEFGEKILVKVMEGNFIVDFPAEKKYDIIYSSYVLDAIKNEDVKKAVALIFSQLKENGKFGNTGLTRGRGFIAQIISVMWEFVYEISPISMGGCRPSEFKENFVDLQNFDVLYHAYKTELGMITSEITVIQKK